MRDINAFRERYKHWKETGELPYSAGKIILDRSEEELVYENGLSLPAYGGGKDDVRGLLDYIGSLENPGRVGLKDGIWRPPTDSTKFDTHQIGMGLDIREEHNPIVYNYLKSKGRLQNPYLTEAEELALREQTWKQKAPILKRFDKKYNLSDRGYYTAAGMLWHGHPFKMMNAKDSVTGRALADAIQNGDRDLDTVFDAYYQYGSNKKRFASRISANNKYWGSKKKIVKLKPKSQLIEQLEQTPVYIPPFEVKQRGETQYPISSNVPQTISSWSSANSPAPFTRMPDLINIMDAYNKIANEDSPLSIHKMDKGTEPKIEYVDDVKVDPVTGEAIMSDNTRGSVILPELTVRPQHLTKSAYHPEDVELFFNLTGAGLLFNPFRLSRTSELLLSKPSFDNALEVAHDVLPWSKAGRFLLGGYNLFNDEGVAKTVNLIKQGEYGGAALSGLGDLLNLAMAVEGGSGAAKLLKSKLNGSKPYIYPIIKSFDSENPSMLGLDMDVQGRKPYVKPKLNKPYLKPNIEVTSKDFYDIVKEDGTINESAFDRAMDVYSKLNNTPYKMSDRVGSELIRKHIMDVVKTAQDSPVPKGYTRQEYVGAALLHDIGKLYGYENHAQLAWHMLYPFMEPNGIQANTFEKQAFSNVPYSVRDAVRRHMDTTTFRAGDENNNLTRAVLFADVGRGIPYDEAALHFPHLLYEREGLMKPQYPALSLREELKKYVNPWLIENGYGPFEDRPLSGSELEKYLESIPRSLRDKGKIPTRRVYTGIPLSATEDEAEAIVRDAIMQHRRVLRGSRLSTGSTNMSKETQELLAKIRDEHLANEIKDRPITNEDRVLWENEHINGTPTGYGRLNLFINHQPNTGLSYNRLNDVSKAYKIDPRKLDGKYVSLSDDVSDHYSSSSNARDNVKSVAQLTGGIERESGMSLREWIALNDWDLYSGRYDLPIGMYNMLESPFRLLTGRSLLYESSKGLYPKKIGIPVEKPLTPQEELIASSFDGFDYNTKDALTREVMDLINRKDRISRLNTAIQRINEYSKRYGLLNFEIHKGKNGEIYYPKEILLLEDQFDDLQRKVGMLERFIDSIDYNKLKEYVQERGSFLKDDLDIIRKNQLHPDWMWNDVDIPQELIISEKVDNELHNFIHLLSLNGVFSKKEADIFFAQLNKGLHNKIIEYIDKHDILNNLQKRLAKNIKEEYFNLIKLRKEESSKIDLKQYLKELKDPRRLISIVRKYGALPRHEMPGFNKTVAIQTAGGTKTKGGKIKNNNKDRDQQMAIIGKFAEKVLDSESNEFNKASGTAVGRGHRDRGKISDKKLTKKTLASILALLTGGSTLKKPKTKSTDE